MKKALGYSVFICMAMALTACGGDSDSSGDAIDDTPVQPTTPNSNQDSDSSEDTAEDTADDTPVQPTTPNSNQMSACVEDSKSNGHYKVPAEGCTYTNPNYNNGQTVTFTCDGTTVKNSLGESSPEGIRKDLNDNHFFCTETLHYNRSTKVVHF